MDDPVDWRLGEYAAQFLRIANIELVLYKIRILILIFDYVHADAAMAQLQNVSREEVSGVLSAFSDGVGRQTSVGVGTDEFLRKVLIDALGPEKASGIIDRISVGRSTKGLEALKWMDGRAVAELIRLEHPQIIAIVLAYLEADQAAEVLVHLPPNTRSDIMVRIATLDGVQPSALSELDDIMEKTFAGKGTTRTSALGGAKAAANIINNLEPSQEGVIMEQITQTDEALGARIADLIFVFDNLLEIDDRSMQELLRQVASDKLLLAMKGCEESMKEKISLSTHSSSRIRTASPRIPATARAG